MGFLDKVVLITGASSGIGAGAARHLAGLGAKVSMVGRNEKRLNEIADQIKNSGNSTADPLLIVGDVTKDAERIVDETIKHFGQLDVLINSAGNATRDSIIDVQMPHFDMIFNSNVRSVVLLTKLCVPYLEKTKGNILNISSSASMAAPPYTMTYSMSKAAVDQLTKSSSVDLAAKGIRVNAISPSLIHTSVIENQGVPAEMAAQMYKDYDSRYPFGRIGEVSDTNAVISFLADNSVASFLTGVLLPVDGGALLAGIM